MLHSVNKYMWIIYLSLGVVLHIVEIIADKGSGNIPV